MKNTDIKFAAGQILLIAGLVVLAMAGLWSLLTGLALLMISSFFSLRRDLRPRSRMARILWTILWIVAVAFVFTIWLTLFGTKKPPLMALFAVWLGCSIDEFNFWRKNRQT